MTKRLLAIITSIFMIMSVFCAVPASAEDTLPANIGTDYVAGEVTGNIVTNGTSGLFGASWSGDFTYGANTNTVAAGLQSGNYYWIKTTAKVTDPTATQYHNPVIGYNIKTAAPADATGRVVYSLTMKDGNGAKIKIGRRNSSISDATNPLRVEYPTNLENGFPLTAGYVTYTGVFEDTGAESSKYAYALGFVEANAQSTFRLDTTKTYIGYEYAYDMKVTASDTFIEPGGAVTFTASVVNQVGDEIAGGQDFTWYALNQERTAIVPGINIHDNGDGTVSVTSQNNVETGTYCIVAVSDAYPQMVKGIDVTVENIDYSDYVPGEITGNLFGDELALSFNYWHRVKLEGESGQVDDVLLSSGAEYYTIRALRNIDDPSVQYSDPDGNGAYSWDGTSRYYHAPYAGGYATCAGVPEGSTANLVYSLKVKNGNSAYTPVVGFGRYNAGIASTANPARVNYPVGCANGSEGFSVTSSDWQTFTGTFEVQSGYTLDNYTGYAVGLAGGNVKGAEVHVSKTEAYLGVEYIHDLTLTADSTLLTTADDVINIDYAVVNQIGTKGAIPQNVEFLVMTPDRQTIIEDSGITITDNGDGTATATIDPFTATPGDYDIVAYNAANRMAKGVRITVKDSDVVSELVLSDFAGDSVTATAKLLNKTQTPVNAILVITMVDDDNEILDIATQSISEVTSSNGIETYTKTLTATDLTKVAKAKAFLLDCGNTASPVLSDTTLGELALSQTVTK